ncbi:unnamed protein product [Chrysodeixis includens]|uniref:FLYWCH-type domain-containing protein n=1 Tax=Chrysodeixis includens TaxID=689277 RepID=A0A9N8L290_CHRIL|nr:unnamed protein product [Chrysodeixis includens]
MLAPVASNGPRMVTSRFGNPIIQVGKYRYYQRAQYKGPRVNWVCSKYRSTNCRAAVTTLGAQIIKTMNDAVFTTSSQGNPVLLVENYRYNWCKRYNKTDSTTKKNWRCVKWSAGCRSSLWTVDSKVVSDPRPHNH